MNKIVAVHESWCHVLWSCNYTGKHFELKTANICLNDAHAKSSAKTNFNVNRWHSVINWQSEHKAHVLPLRIICHQQLAVSPTHFAWRHIKGEKHCFIHLSLQSLWHLDNWRPTPQSRHPFALFVLNHASRMSFHFHHLWNSGSTLSWLDRWKWCHCCCSSSLFNVVPGFISATNKAQRDQHRFVPGIPKLQLNGDTAEAGRCVYSASPSVLPVWVHERLDGLMRSPVSPGFRTVSTRVAQCC